MIAKLYFNLECPGCKLLLKRFNVDGEEKVSCDIPECEYYGKIYDVPIIYINLEKTERINLN